MKIINLAKTPGALPSIDLPLNERGYGSIIAGADISIYIYGVIGIKSDNIFGIEGITAGDVRDDLKNIGNAKTINLHINSEGGSVTEAEAIISNIAAKKARVVVNIDGLAASAASFIALMGDEIRIADGGYVMIHEARCDDDGTIKGKQQAIDLLGRVNAKMAQRYAARAKKDPTVIAAWMAEEKWFIGQEAVDAGFADKVVGNMRVAACLQKPEIYQHVPSGLKPNQQRAAAAFARIAALKN